jgi:hypothetical protein
MPKLEEQLNEQTLKGTVSVNDQNLQQALIETAVLDDLNDVAISSPTNGQILQYDSADSTWKNENKLDGASIINSTLENNTVTTGTYSSPVNEALLIKARKASAGTITKGQVVYIVGSTGSHLTVELAQADAEATSAYTIGIAATTITNTADGYVMQNGRLTGLSTLPTASFTDGDALYLSEVTAGGYRVGIPTAPNHGVFLGFVVRASNGATGEIDVRIDNYQELEELSDVNITGVAANNFLVRNATNTRWENKTTSDVKTTLNIDTLELQTKIRNAGLINGFIRVTVASNNLTVAVSTSPTSQVDPTASNPVYVFINGVLRSITGALSVTANAGTNWFNAGSSELATKEIDYFAYIGYNATDGVVLGFSRIPYARLYSDFNTTTTNEKYARISTITNASSGDNYINVGRFAATLSASASFNWSVPSFTNANLIQEPIFETRYLEWIPTYGGSNAMTYTSVTTGTALYKLQDTSLHIILFARGTTGGTGNITITATMPFTFDIGAFAFPTNAIRLPALVRNDAEEAGMVFLESQSNVLTFRRDGNNNWSIGGNKDIACDLTLPIRRL